jgi:DNA-binding NarL/FixJ family response regulator
MSDVAAGAVAQRVLLVDDHPIVRQGLRRLIGNEPGLVVCAEAETLREARQAIRELAPDVVVADISLKDGDGIDLVKDIRAHHPGLPVLVLSMHDESVYAERMLSAGAAGYIMKDAASDQFILALRRVLAGRVYVSEALTPTLGGRNPAPAADAAHPVSRLSNRELQILQMIGAGQSSRQIADTLHLSVKTVEAHRQRIKGKLELASGAQLVQFAAHWAASH